MKKNRASRKILLAMPGKPHHQQRLWNECFKDTGLAEHTEICFQANAKWNDKYPQELLQTFTPTEIAEIQYRHTRVRTDDDWNPKPPVKCYLDYEPHKPELQGPESSWLWKKIEQGYKEEDNIVVRSMMRGVQEATDGLPLSVYRLPALHKKKLNTRELLLPIKTSKKLVNQMSWVWMDCYNKEPITREKLVDQYERLSSHKKRLRRTGKEVIPFVFASYDMTERDARISTAVTIMMLKQLNFRTIGVWANMSFEDSIERQMVRMKDQVQYLQQFLRVQEE